MKLYVFCQSGSVYEFKYVSDFLFATETRDFSKALIVRGSKSLAEYADITPNRFDKAEMNRWKAAKELSRK